MHFGTMYTTYTHSTRTRKHTYLYAEPSASENDGSAKYSSMASVSRGTPAISTGKGHGPARPAAETTLKAKL